MQAEQFWELIEQSRQGANGCDTQVSNLVSILATLPLAEIIDFDRHMARLRIEAYRWDLWGIAAIVKVSCSDDAFEYFRCWLISQGREFYEAALASPERIAERVGDGEVAEDDDAECEWLMYAADCAYENTTAGRLPPTEIEYPPEPAGERWSEEDLERRYPELCQRFWGESIES